MSSYEKQISQLIREAVRQGFRYRKGSNSHHIFYPPSGAGLVTAPHTPSIDNAFRIVMGKMRRAGFKEENDMTPSITEKEQHSNGHAKTSLGDLLKQAVSTKAVDSLIPPSGCDSRSDSGMLGMGSVTLPSAPPKAAELRRGDIGPWISAYMLRHLTNAMNVKHVHEAAEAHFGPVPYNSVANTLSRLAREGELRTMGRGVYMREPNVTELMCAHEHTGPTSGVKTTATIDTTSVGGRPPLLDVDPDERELDEALAALGRIEIDIRNALNEMGRIETVVRKYKGITRKVRELKAMLSGGEL